METWSWPTGAPADERRSYPLFPILPNWKSGVTETLTWMTDIMISEQNVEQRRSVRRYPRRTFEGSFLRAGAARARIDHFFAGTGRKLCLMPIWHEQFALRGEGRTDGIVVFPAGSLAKREFRMGDLVMITTGDPDKTFILSVTVYNEVADSITLQGLTASGQWPAGSRIIPLRVARVLDATSISNPADRVGVSQIRFQLMDADSNFLGDWNYCSPLWRYKPDRQVAVDVSYDRKDYLLDFEAGVMALTETSERAAINTSMRYTFFGRDEVSEMRAFLYNARGRARRFYMPSYTVDLVAAEAIATGNTFDVLPSGFIDYMDSPQQARRIVSVEFKDGRPTIYRNILSVVNIPELSAPFSTRVERITVDLDMPPIEVDEIARISFVVPTRFDQDSFEIFHHTDGLKAVSVSVAVKSSVVDGMPPIECWTTSLPYSVVESEQMQSNATITSGRMYAPLYFMEPEAVSSAATFTAGTLRAILQTYVAPPEAVESTTMITAGTLRAILRSYTYYAPEAVSSAATFTAGTLKAVLIRYTSPPEAVQPSATITQGTLT